MSSSSARSAFSHLGLRRDYCTDLHIVKINAKFSRSRLRTVIHSLNISVPGNRYLNLDASHFSPDLYETSCVLLSLEPPLRSYLFLFDADQRGYTDPFLLWVIWGTTERDFKNFCMVVRNKNNVVQVRIGFGNEKECFISNFELYQSGKTPRAFNSLQRYLYDRDLIYLATPLWVILGPAWRDSNLNIVISQYNPRGDQRSYDSTSVSPNGYPDALASGNASIITDVSSLLSDTMSVFSASSEWAMVEHADTRSMVNMDRATWDGQGGDHSDVIPSNLSSLGMAELQYVLDGGSLDE